MKRIDLVYNFCRDLFKNNESFLNFFENHYAEFFTAFNNKRKLKREDGLDLLVIRFGIDPSELKI